jgi:hypothetical protein
MMIFGYLKHLSPRHRDIVVDERLRIVHAVFLS